MRAKQSKTAKISRKTSWDHDAIVASLIFIVAFSVRFPLLFQSFWYDELYWLLYFALVPLHTTVTAFSPNNHALYSLLGKLSASVIGGQSEWAWRLPSALAGCGVAIALAWPLRRKNLLLALFSALIAAANPWLASFSTEARGYALLLFLAVLATNWLPLKRRGISWKYSAVMVAAIYTVPLGILLVPAHALAMFVVRRRSFICWMFSTALAGFTSALLYAPFIPGVRQYAWRGESVRQWTSPDLLRFATDAVSQLFTGYSTDHSNLLAAAAVILMIPGAVMAWKISRLRIPLITFSVASLLAMLLPNVLFSAAASRFVFWLIPLFVICLAGLAGTAPFMRKRPAVAILVASIFLVLESLGWIGLYSEPKQPIRDALALCSALAGPQGKIIGIYIAATESRIYDPNQLEPAYNLADLKRAEVGANLWAIEYDPEIVHAAAPELEAELYRNFNLRERLPGRLADALIWQIKAAPR